MKLDKLIGENILNLPNMITTFRLLLIPLFVTNLVKLNKDFALIILTIIILTDMLDGISARITWKITKFGRVYDAFVDFVVIVSSLIVFYITGLIELFWILIFAVPSITLTITRISHYRKLKEFTSGALGKIVVGIAYVAVFSVIIDFVYKSEILIIIAVLAYIYMIMDVYKIFIKNKALLKK